MGARTVYGSLLIPHPHPQPPTHSPFVWSIEQCTCHWKCALENLVKAGYYYYYYYDDDDDDDDDDDSGTSHPFGQTDICQTKTLL